MEAGMADLETESCPVGMDQNVVSDGIIVGDMCTVGAMPTVTSEMVHVPADNYVYLVANSGNELSFVSSDRMTSHPDNGWSSSRLTGAHCLSNPPDVDRPSHVGATLQSSSTWRRNSQSGELDRPVFRTTLEMEVKETRQMLSQQQIALSSLTDTLKSIQDEIKSNKEVRPTSGSSSGSVNKKSKVERLISNSAMFIDNSDSESSDSEEEGDEEDDSEEPPSKQTKLNSVEGENRSGDSHSKLSKLNNLFNDKSEQGPKVNENLAKTLNRGISNNFSIKTALEFGENYKSPENCEFLRVPKLNEELYFEESIATRYKKSDGMLQKTQMLLTKGMIPLVQLMDKLLKSEEDSEIFDLATDSLQLLAYTHRDISTVRRKFLKPAVAQKYKRLCAANVPLTACLLGDDLDKQLKLINERKKIGFQMTGEVFQNLIFT